MSDKQKITITVTGSPGSGTRFFMALIAHEIKICGIEVAVQTDCRVSPSRHSAGQLRDKVAVEVRELVKK